MFSHLDTVMVFQYIILDEQSILMSKYSNISLANH